MILQKRTRWCIKLELTIEGRGQTIEQLKAELATYRSQLTAQQQQQQLESQKDMLDATALEHAKTQEALQKLFGETEAGLRRLYEGLLKGMQATLAQWDEENG